MKNPQLLDSQLESSSPFPKILLITLLTAAVPVSVSVLVVNSQGTDNQVSASQILLLVLLVLIIALASAFTISKKVRETKKNDATNDTPLPVGKNEKRREIYEDLQREHKEVLSLFSHDLQSPYSSIVSAVQLIKMEPEADESEGFLQHIEDLSRDQIMVLRKMLHSIKARDIMQDGSLKYSTIDLRELIADLKEEKKPAIVKKSISVIEKVSLERAELPYEVVKIAISNALDNALKFTNKGGEVTIDVEAGADQMHIRIEDNGIGFPTDKAEEIFSYDSPLIRRGTEQEKSMGIGMHLTQRLINMAGGSIKAHSDGENQGASVTISIPIKA